MEVEGEGGRGRWRWRGREGGVDIACSGGNELHFLTHEPHIIELKCSLSTGSDSHHITRHRVQQMEPLFEIIRQNCYFVERCCLSMTRLIV